jgi:glycine cleavage system H protein
MTASESFGTVESVKAVSKRCSPVSGEVTGVTSKLRTSQEILNPDFHRDGQAVFVQIPDWKVGMNPLAADDCEVYL